MLQLDYFGVLLTVFILGPRHWRWCLAAAGVAKVVTILTLAVWRVELTAYTMGGVFNQLDMGSRFVALIISLIGPFACYSVARILSKNPLGQGSLLQQILPWSELENPMAGTFAKFAFFSAIFGLLKVF